MPRLIPDDALVEITMRTQGGRFLLRPAEKLDRRILGILGRALHLYPVTLYAFAFLSNHYHMMVRALDGAALSSFLRYFNGSVAKATKEETGWDLRVWQRRASVIEVIDNDAAADRMRYILAHGAKEGLVASPLEWPGLTCARALTGAEELVGRWRSQTKISRIRATGREPIDSEVERVYPIVLAPLPGWEAFTVEERRVKAADMVADIERDARLHHPVPLGVSAVGAQSPFGRSAEPKRNRAPCVHSSTLAGYLAFRAARKALVDAYRAGTEELKQGRDAWLPASTFLPAVLYCRGEPMPYVGFTPPPDPSAATSRGRTAGWSSTRRPRASPARLAESSPRAPRPSGSPAAPRPLRRSAPG